MNDDVKEANKSSDPMGALMERRKYQGQSFGSAFREARKGGEKTFFWNGKKYTTDMAPDKAPAPAPAGSAPAPAEAATRVGTERGRASMGNAAARVGTERGRREAPKPADDMRAGRGTGMAPQYALSDVERPGTNVRYENKDTSDMAYKKGGKVKCYAKGGSVRGGGCESKGKTKGRMV